MQDEARVRRKRSRRENQNVSPLHLTFNKKSQGEGEAVHADRHQPGSCADEHNYPIDPEEQVHGAVLPVHQLDPGAVLSVVEAGVRPAHHKLFHHYTCGGTNTVTPDRPALAVLAMGEDSSPTKEAKLARPPSA